MVITRVKSKKVITLILTGSLGLTDRQHTISRIQLLLSKWCENYQQKHWKYYHEKILTPPH